MIVIGILWPVSPDLGKFATGGRFAITGPTMTEILVKTSDGSGYRKDAPLHVANRRDCLCVHAQHICHPRKARRRSGGLVRSANLAHDFLEITQQYRFERIGDRVRRFDLWEQTEAEFGSTGPERMEVGQHIAMLIKSPHFAVFGEEGREHWFGGRADYSADKMAQVWGRIERKSDNNRADHLFWPFSTESKPQRVRMPQDGRYFGGDRQYHTGRAGEMVTAILGGQELRSHAAIKIDRDLTDAEKEQLTEPENDESGELRFKRKRRIEWIRAVRDAAQRREVDDICCYTDLRNNGAIQLKEKGADSGTPTDRHQLSTGGVAG